MGNQQAVMQLSFDHNKKKPLTFVNGWDDIQYTLPVNHIQYVIPDRFGDMSKLDFVATSNPSNFSFVYFFNVTEVNNANRTVRCAFVDINNTPVIPDRVGAYATAVNIITNRYDVFGIMTIVPKPGVTISENIFSYISPTIRATSSSNSTITNEGIVMFNGQVTNNPDLTQVQYTPLEGISNGNGQFLVDVELKNEDDIIDIQYSTELCPSINSIVYDGENLIIETNIPIPKITMLFNMLDGSLGLTPSMTFTMNKIDDTHIVVGIVNSSFRNVMHLGYFMTLSILILPLGE